MRDFSSPFREGPRHALSGVTVLQLATELDSKAGTRLVFDLVNALGAAGARPLVASAGGPLKGELQAIGGVDLPFSAQAKNPLAMALSCRRLAGLIEAERVDLVHVRSRALAWIALGACRMTKTALVTSFDAGTEDRLDIAKRYNSILARGDLVLASSRFSANLAERLHPAATGKIKIVPPGVDSRIYAAGKVLPARVEALRQDWKVAQHEQIILMAMDSRASSYDKSLVEAVRLLAASGVAGVQFILLGDPETRSRGLALDRSIGRSGLQNLMHRAFERDRPAAFLAASAVVSMGVTKSAFETVLQAQAMGTPVIAASPGPAAQAVLASPHCPDRLRTGYLVKPGDAAAISLAIARILTLGASAAAELSDRACNQVETHFSTSQFCAATLNAYQSVLARHSRRVDVAARGDGSETGPPRGRQRLFLRSGAEAGKPKTEWVLRRNKIGGHGARSPVSPRVSNLWN